MALSDGNLSYGRLACCRLIDLPRITDPRGNLTFLEGSRQVPFPITMTYEAILEMAEAFPDRLVFFAASVGDQMIASSICLRIYPSVLYVFYWGDLPGWEKFSPVSLLADAIYEYGRQTGIRLLDLGTSTNHGVPNYGLLNFKREMGCVESLKLTFVKHLS